MLLLMLAAASSEPAVVDAVADVIVRVRGRHAVNRGNPYTIHDGGLLVQDPSDEVVYEFDWDAEALAEDASIDESTFTVTALRPSTATALQTADEDIGDNGRTARVTLSGGALGALYRIDHRIVTDETPAQTKERSFRLKIENR
jgi:hypothetical protein